MTPDEVAAAVRPRCTACGEPVGESYVYHQRLAVYVCSTCPLTDVHGEDISTHSLYFYRQPLADSARP